MLPSLVFLPLQSTDDTGYLKAVSLTKPYTPEGYNLYHLVHYCVLSIYTCPVQKKHSLNIL